ncbi:hypothetical protein PAF17_02925 [Paracoccus sp. Z330]|uniref:Dynamin n=1 Tax=Paracoccus onchidii TaxID=3017813 RepID=A0ABT4ZAS2_9RHOB|nr:hypothetical protein [Paracoccus onchidii]MDB6176454.1 hypothetical protein [Paracoccus onchidii]
MAEGKNNGLYFIVGAVVVVVALLFFFMAGGDGDVATDAEAPVAEGAAPVEGMPADTAPAQPESATQDN